MRAFAEATTIVSKLRSDTKRRDLPMTLTVQDVIEVRIGKACHYCGGALKSRTPSLDRVDNLRGYHRGNVVPCCSMCNWARGGLLTYEEFSAAVRVRVARLGWGKAWPERAQRERRVHDLRGLGVEEARLAARVGGVFAARRMERKRAKALDQGAYRERSDINMLAAQRGDV